MIIARRPSVNVLLVRGDARALPLRDASVDCVVTSPPYWGLRDYGLPPTAWGGEPGHGHVWSDTEPREAYVGKTRWQHTTRGQEPPEAGVTTTTRETRPEAWGTVRNGAWCECGAWAGSLGLEPTIDLFVSHMVDVFDEVRRVLKPTGTLWLNLGDSYATGAGSARRPGGDCFGKANKSVAVGAFPLNQPNRMPQIGLKPKDLCGIPWRVALALQADGWWLRSDIVWSKPNPMPESIKDRPTRSHEYVFLMSKAERYFYDTDAIRERFEGTAHSRLAVREVRGFDTRDCIPGIRSHVRKRESEEYTKQAAGDPPHTGLEGARKDWKARKKTAETPHAGGGRQAPEPGEPGAFHPNGRNARSVWTIPTQPYSGAHFATFPEELARRCIAAGCPPGGLVLDPFGGSGTVGRVAIQLGRAAVCVDLAYHQLAARRVSGVQRPLLET